MSGKALKGTVRKGSTLDRALLVLDAHVGDWLSVDEVLFWFDVYGMARPQYENLYRVLIRAAREKKCVKRERQAPATGWPNTTGSRRTHVAEFAMLERTDEGWEGKS